MGITKSSQLMWNPSRLNAGSMSVTNPIAWKVPRSVSFVTTDGLISTQIVLTLAGRRFPTAIECNIVPIIMAMVTPPNFERTDENVERLEHFLGILPKRHCHTLEFRHASWLDDEVFDRLRRRNLALCVADSEKMSTPVRITADYAYFRLRDEGYTPDDIVRWADTIARETPGCRDVFVYFKHEEEGKGPEFAKLLMRHLGLA